MGIFGSKKPDTGMLGEGLVIKNKLSYQEGKALTLAVADAGRGREYPLLPRVTPARFEWYSKGDPPVEVDYFTHPDMDHIKLFVAYWSTEPVTMKIYGFINVGNQLNIYDNTIVKNIKNLWNEHGNQQKVKMKYAGKGEELRIVAPTVPERIVSLSLQAAGIPEEPKYFSEAARGLMMGYELRIGQGVDGAESSGLLPVGSADRFRANCGLIDNDLDKSFQNMFDQWQAIAPHVSYIATDYPFRVPAVVLLEPADFMATAPELGAT